jgi:dTDP-4-amino-4,6-dideoxygalactose transaminase
MNPVEFSRLQISTLFSMCATLYHRCRSTLLGRFSDEDWYTTTESERLVRLPMWYGLSEVDQLRVVAAVNEFYA